MRTYKKQKIALLLAALLFMCALCAVALASGRVFDDAGLLDDEEQAEIEARIEELQAKYQMDFAALTVADAEGKSTEVYCADYYEAQGMGADGVLLCIDMDNRLICLVTHGEAIQLIDDSRRESVYDDMYSDVSNGWYKDAFMAGLDSVAAYIDEGVRHGQFTYDRETGAISSIYYAEDQALFQAGLETGEFTYDEATGTYYYNQNYTPTLRQRLKATFTPAFTGGAAAAGAGAGFASSSGVKKSYKRKAKNQSFAFAASHAMNLVGQNDNLRRTYTTTRIIPRNTDNDNRGGGMGGGGSTFGSGTFSSSSGGSFGGGGGRSF